ncbi:DUF5666 domain-containing protein [Variovorax sp. PBL-E5]|uniref:DUF5666 domain-containing protein n=1 Tax=Variovorax sp. PBL-E5 TaxID=434014 RepID=UPI0013162469|nr:DUF5666 domain-containing protein [Variovorax sp. PBL-E5]VTU25133.1 hypothetical protein E5CHR_01934 [Variovorax sp. PBL-E5]
MNTRFWRGGLNTLLIALLISCGGGGSSSGSVSANVAASTDGGTLTATVVAGGGTDSASSSAASGSTTTASNGNGSGVGSGGTGISVAGDATSVGAVDGIGSIIVNGLRYDIDSATIDLRDAATLQIGMSVKVMGSVDASFTNGVATQVTSAADLRGPVTAIDPIGGSFAVMGTTVTIDEATVWADVPGLASLIPGTTIQVWGLPASPGVLRATRVQQQIPSAAPIATGTVQQLDLARGTFALGGLTVAYGSASFAGGINPTTLTNGTIVRVRADTQASPGLLMATQVESWYPIPGATGTPIQLEGVITNYAALNSFQVLGRSINASAAQITGGQASKIGNGVKIQVGGTLVNGVLVATEIKIKHIPGAGALPSFTLIGSIGNYVSAASFRVHGQLVDASAPDVVFVNGTQANLANGVKVTAVGAEVVNGILLASQVSFGP